MAPRREPDEAPNGAPQGRCPACGLAEADWPASGGAAADGLRYCCAGCAGGEGCSCSPAAGSGLPAAGSREESHGRGADGAPFGP